MEKKLENFSIKLENLLRSNKFITENREDLLFYMFGGSSFEDQIKKILSKDSLFDYFLIGKILFLIKDIDNILKNNNELTKLIKSKEYIIIKENFKIEDLESFLLETNENNSIVDEPNITDNWDYILEKIKNLDVIIKSKAESKYFNYNNSTGDTFKLSQIITPDFIKSCQKLFESKANKYKKYKLENALFLNELSKAIKNRTDLDNLIKISKDKVSDFKIISTNLNKNRDWDSLSWKKIKNLKEKI